MANQNDSFIDEVTEDLRRDRLFAAMRRYGWLLIAAILLLVGWSAWHEWSTRRAATQAQAFGDAVLAAEAIADPAARAAALDAVVADRPGREALRGLMAGGAWAQAGDGAKAAAALDATVRNAADDAVLRDLARLKSVLAQGSEMDPSVRDAALTELSAPGAPFELLALEQKAVALIGAGRNDDAVALIRQIQKRDGLTEALSGRLSEMLVALGVEPEPADADQATPDPTRAAEVVPSPGQKN